MAYLILQSNFVDGSGILMVYLVPGACAVTGCSDPEIAGEFSGGSIRVDCGLPKASVLNPNKAKEEKRQMV